MRSVKALFAAFAASASLSACVGVDPQVAQRPGGGASLAAFDTPATQKVSTAMPGDLLFDPERTEGGINPQAILMRSERRYAQVRAPGSTLAARLAETPKQLSPAKAASPSLLAAHTAPLPATARVGTPSALLEPTPLAEVEARAAIEQRAQNVRDKRFDEQVRRASTLVCSGCLSTSRSRHVQAQATDDTAD